MLGVGVLERNLLDTSNGLSGDVNSGDCFVLSLGA